MNILNSELIKLFTIRSTWIYLALISLVGAGAAVMHSFSAQSWDANALIGWSQLTVGADFALLIMIFAAAVLVGADLNHKTITWSYLSNNHRLAHLGIQAVTVVVALLVAAGLSIVLAIGGNLVLGIPMDLSHNFAPLTSALVTWTVFSVSSALLTVIVGNGMFAAMILLADFFIIEVMLGIANIDWLRPVLDLLPLANSRVLGLGTFNAIEHGRPVAAVILIATIAIFSALAASRVQRRAVR